MTGGVYKITHRPSGRVYVGSTKDFASRWRKHRDDLLSGKHHNPALLMAFRVDGSESLEFEILEPVHDPDRLGYLEMFWADKLNAFDDGFNSAPISRYAREISQQHRNPVRWKLKSCLETHEIVPYRLAKASSTPPPSIYRMLRGDGPRLADLEVLGRIVRALRELTSNPDVSVSDILEEEQ